MKIEDLHIGQRVKWNDPDGDECSGEGIVISVREDGLVDLRKDDGGEFGAMAHELSELNENKHKEKNRDKQEYIVSMRVDGRVNVIVEASSFEEAFELAEKEEYDPTKVECIEYAPVNATDSRGIQKDYN